MEPADKRRAERLKQARETLKLTQVQMAESLNMSPSGYRNYELGVFPVPYRKIRAVANTYGIRTEWLAEGTGAMFDKSEAGDYQKSVSTPGHVAEGPTSSYSAISSGPPPDIERRIDEFAERYRAAVDLVNEVLRLRPLTPPPPRLMVETLKTIALRGVTREEMLFLLTALEEYRAGAGRP